MSAGCCSAHPVTQDHLGAALSSAGTTVTAANHAAGKTVGASAEILVVGTIATGNPAAPLAEAMAISGGAIIGIGALKDVEGLVDSSTKTVKPEGVVVPGLIEPHMHIWTSLLNLTWTDVSHEVCATFDDVVAVLKTAAAATPAGQYVLGKLFDPSLFPGEPDLTLDILDQISPNNPVIVMNASMHYLYANTAAFAAAGITYDTPDPVGGNFGRADGKLTGVIGEAPAMMMVLATFPKPSAQELAAGITEILTECAKQGVTSLREGATGTLAGVSELAMLHQLNGAKRLPVRVSTAQFAIMAGKTPEQVAQTWKDAGVTPFSGDEMVRADAWKVVADGSNQGRSGYFMQPYLGENNGGHGNWTPETLRGAIRAGLNDGWQINLHTNGDAAVEMALEAMEEILPGSANADLRHAFVHYSVTTDDQLARTAKLGISATFLMNHVLYWGAAFRDTILGAERADRLDRVASAIKAGINVSLHSDYNVSKVHPLLSAQTAVLRRLQADGSVLNAAESATPAQALAAITRDAAWQIHADDRGSLEVGKRADYAVLDSNPWTSDPESWDKIVVNETYIDGTLAFQA
ncbi:MAG: amidohydrolase [Aurantimicrobium sp.]